jgi:hypothetical protein
MGHITALAQAQLPSNDASSLSFTASILFFVIVRGISVIREFCKDLEHPYQSSGPHKYLRVTEHILDLNRVLREVVVQLDGATRGQQTSTEALIQFECIASVFFSCVFPQILEYHPLTSNYSELHFTEGLH